MIPFKPKTNGMTCAAILLILVCLSGTCASLSRTNRKESSDDARVRSAENSRQTRNGVISHDVRADSRQSRIDSSDIRTDFREIRTELPRSASRQYEPEHSADRRFADRVVTERRQLDRRSLERSRQTRKARSDLRDREANRRIFDEDRNMPERETNRRSDASRQTRTIREARSDLREREANRRFSEDRESDRRIISNGRLSEYRAQSENRIEASTRRLSDARQNRVEKASNTREFFEAKAREGSESNQAALTNSLIRAGQAILLVALVGQLLGNGSKKNPIRSWPMFAKVH